jgi:membrane protein implicated in regulation of membrane protease activity
MEFLDQMVFWHWWVLAIILIIAEIFSMSLFALFIAMAAAIVGVLAWILPDMSWTAEFILFSVLSLVSIVGWHYYRKANPLKPTDQPSLNRRGSQYVGRVFTLDAATENGVGKLKVDDSTWKIVAEKDFKKGDKVKVIALDGVVLKVEKA